jgi:hypothetical protein
MDLLDFCQTNSKYAHLIEEWNEELNGRMQDYAPHSNKIVSWICRVDEHHEWTTQINHRTKAHGTNCSICVNQKVCPKDYCNSVYMT